jgi:hypothetical protein
MCHFLTFVIARSARISEHFGAHSSETKGANSKYLSESTQTKEVFKVRSSTYN